MTKIFSFFISTAHAETTTGNTIFDRMFRPLEVVGEEAFCNPPCDIASFAQKNPPIEIAVYVVNILLLFLGIMVILALLYAGWLYMTSNGEAPIIERAKKIFFQASIGALIILMSLSITNFVLNVVSKSTNTEYLPLEEQNIPFPNP